MEPIDRRRLLCCAACGLPGLLALARGARADTSITSLPALGDAAQGLLPPDVEARLGERIMAEIRQDPSYLRDVQLRDYVQAIVDSLAPAAIATAEPDAPRSFEAFILADPTFNAFALPGGHIAIHTGLIVAAQARDQIAAVMAHEMSHITQRHLAQRLAHAGADNLLSIAGLVLAVVAGASGNANAAAGLAMGGEGAALQRELSFSRDNERVADRVGTAVLRASGYPPQAMASMLERLQDMMRLDSGDVYAFLRDHPLNSERIADAEARGGGHPLPPDTSPAFWLMNARARVVQVSRRDDLARLAAELAGPSADRPSDLVQQRAAWSYGRGLALLRIGHLDPAAEALDAASHMLDGSPPVETLAIELARGDLLLARKQAGQALDLGRQLATVAPADAAPVHLQAQALLAMPDKAPAVDFLRQQTVLRPRDEQLWTWLAQACADTGALAAQHRATAEAYALDGNVEGAVLQLKIAQRTPGAGFIDASIIDARLEAMRQRLARDKALDKRLPQ